MARALGALAVRVTTPAELEAAMASAEANPGAFLIEAVTARDDLSPVMTRIRSHPRVSPHPTKAQVSLKTWCAAAHGRRR